MHFVLPVNQISDTNCVHTLECWHRFCQPQQDRYVYLIHNSRLNHPSYVNPFSGYSFLAIPRLSSFTLRFYSKTAAYTKTNPKYRNSEFICEYGILPCLLQLSPITPPIDPPLAPSHLCTVVQHFIAFLLP